MKKTKYLLIILGLFMAPAVLACVSHNVSGWAWSDNIGWISMNCNNRGGAVDYGVDFNENTGAMSGYAWSSNIGWIDFSGASINLANGNITGWIHSGVRTDDGDKAYGDCAGWRVSDDLNYGNYWNSYRPGVSKCSISKNILCCKY